MTDLDFESSQLQLITDALRAGPGSPAWREALAAIEHSPDADEFKVLYAARERLASGRTYREVRAGAGFTRKVFDAIEQEQAAGEGNAAAALPSANLIAILSALVILVILGVVAFFIIPRSTAPSARDDLAQTYFVNTQAQSNFESELGADWKAFGPLRVETHSGLRPILQGLAPSSFKAAGVSYQRPLPADQPVAIAAAVKIPGPSNDLIVQVFVADDNTFTGDSATSPHELVCWLRGTEASVYLNGSAAAQGANLPTSGTIDVRISLNRSQAAVDLNGRRIWAGSNGLDGGRARTVGVRFLAQGEVGQADAPVVESIRVLGAKKP